MFYTKKYTTLQIKGTFADGQHYGRIYSPGDMFGGRHLCGTNESIMRIARSWYDNGRRRVEMRYYQNQ